jgi:hypothetical protein
MPEFRFKNYTKSKKRHAKFHQLRTQHFAIAIANALPPECYKNPKSRSSEVSASSRKALPQRELKNDELRRAIIAKLRFHLSILSDG